jgi:para-nitrobenzyl esterase
LEVPFVFDDRNTGIGEFLLGDASPDGLATTMHETWLSFARTGLPSGPGLPEWPEYDLETRPIAVFDAACSVEYDRDARRRQVWDGADILHHFPSSSLG